MPRHHDRVTLSQMRDFARMGARWAREHSRADLSPVSLETLGLVKLVESIGEAANRVGEETRIALPEIPWIEIVGTRNRLVHGYDSIDLDILWEILSRDLDRLTRILEGFLGG